jgi:hypothetical protein
MSNVTRLLAAAAATGSPGQKLEEVVGGKH